MRFDDTNPTKEKTEFVESIKADIKWLGADWEDRLFFASNYFDQMYEAAVKLIKKGKAYVCDLTPEQIREYRGTLTEPGKESPYRNRSIEENLDAELDIPFMTSKIGMSHSTFYRKVKALTGISANEFIRKVRLKNSLQLLLTGTYNISEAAYMTGFNNVSYYRQCFKDEYGMSPTEYLKSCR